MPGEGRPPPSPGQRAQAQAQALGLSPATALRCADLAGRGGPDPADVEQPQRDFFALYAAARNRAPAFREAVRAFGARRGVQADTRPGDVKRLDRIVEKYSVSLEQPLDLLGGKVVVGSLRHLYEVAFTVPEHFEVVAYRDRVLRPQKSGYRDLQFVVALGGTGGPPHYAELKVLHTLFDQMDGFEHRLYEIRRGLEAKERDRLREPQAGQGWGEEPWGTNFGSPILSPVEQMVLEELGQSSRTLFERTWALVQAQEHPP